MGLCVLCADVTVDVPLPNDYVVFNSSKCQNITVYSEIRA